MPEKPEQFLEHQFQLARPRRGEVERVPLTPEEKEFLGEIMDKAVAAEKAGDLAKAIEFFQEYWDEFLKIKDKLKEKNEIEKNLEKQYHEQIDILTKTNLIEQLPNKELGFYDINGKPRRIPTYEEILERVESKKEFVEKKREQGFSQLLLVPFGMKLSDMADKAKELILKKYKEGNLKGTNGDDLELDEKEPVSLEEKYQGGNADISGELVYFPEKFDKENHGGKTKQEILAGEEGKESKIPGWDIMFIEDSPDLPAEGKGKEVGGRKQLEANKSLDQYLKKMKEDEQYKGEQGMTPEGELTYFMHYLQKNNKVIDDFQGSGKINWNLGGYLKTSDCVCNTHWSEFFEKLSLSWNFSATHNANYGVRSSVRI